MADNYTVTGQRPSSRVNANMNIERTYEVTFTTKPSGFVGVAEIPVGQFNPDNVHATIDPLALNLEAVAKL